MIKPIKDPRLNFSVAASRMSSDMGLPIADCMEYAALLDPDFADRLIKYAIAEDITIGVNHGNRSLGYQDLKANNPDNKYKWNPGKLPEGGGSIKDQCKCWSHASGTLLAPPGQSPHMCGIAIDAAGALRSASAAAIKPYGLHKPVSGEAWHVEPILAKRPKGYARYELAVALGMPFIWPRVKKGIVGVTVCQVQQRLSLAGFDVAVDGIFGDKTKAIIEAFQRAKGLPITGIADAATLKALGLNQIDKGEEDMLIKIGSKGPVVAAFQRALISAGFPGKMDVAKISDTSPFGEKSADATRLFQEACGLPQTGEVDDATIAAMLNKAAGFKVDFDTYKTSVALRKADAKAELNALAAAIEKI